MTKKTFIQNTAALFVACHHKHPGRDKAIEWAENLWESLEARGYGGTKKQPGKIGAKLGNGKPRVGIDYYGQLNQEQKQVFDDFWLRRFNLKDGKQRAVMVFIEHWDVINNEREMFLQGAAKEAQLRMTRETTPPLAEKWINQLRWRDHDVPKKSQQQLEVNEKAARIQALHQELAHFKRLQKADDNDMVREMISGIEKKLTAEQAA